MRTHEDIVRGFGASAIAHALRARGVVLAANTPQRWRERNSIPAQYWPDIVAIGASTLKELSAAAAAKPKRQTAA